MKKWAIIDTREHEEDIVVFGSKEIAVVVADAMWNVEMTSHDRECRVSFIVGLINVELDDNGYYQYYEDEDGNIDSAIYDIAETFK